MLNKLVSKQHLQGLSCLLPAHLLNDSTKTWSGALLLIGLWAFGLYDNFDTVHMRWKNNTAGDWLGLSHSSAPGVGPSIPWGKETEVSECGCVCWGAEEQGAAAEVKNHLCLGSHLRVFFHPGTISSLQKMSYISYLWMCINTISVSVEGEREINIYICVCVYICKYMYVLYTQNLSIH